MNLVPESRYWHKLWSVRFLILAGFFEVMPQIITMWSDVIPPAQLEYLVPFFMSAAFISRFIKQNLNDVQQP